MKYLASKGIATLIHYPIPIHKQPCFAKYKKDKLVVLDKKIKSILSLPIHPFLTIKEIKYICESIRTFYK